ncbi:MAG: PrsW family glutamic-type intramembrane protease [Clostridia bacterium]|nr:PrsW family glutamic-type intramembrane protease [Clostridia bacterium]
MYGFHPILVIAAVIPALFLLWRIYKADKLEKESPRMLITLVILGAVSTAIAVILELAGSAVLGIFLPENSIIYIAIENFIVVGLSEEWSKYIVLKKATWKSPEFNCMFDGVVYATFVSLGFALWENIKYVSAYGLMNALVRAVTAVPGHTAFGVFMGIFYALSKRAELNGRLRQSKNSRRMCILLPAFIHGMYDFLATIDGSDLLFLPFIIVLFIFAFRTVKRWSREDDFIPDPVSEASAIRTQYDAPRKDNDYTKF